MDTGDKIRVYREVDTRIEVCNRGEQHRVPIYEVKVLTVTEIRRELVDRDGYGDVLYAVDAQQRTYRKKPHWDGPRATLWLRGSDQRAFTQYPPRVFSRDLLGRPLRLR